MTVIKAGTITRLSRGGGVETIPLITRQSADEDNKITTGISIYPEGTGAPLHLHNCDEHATLWKAPARWRSRARSPAGAARHHLRRGRGRARLPQHGPHPDEDSLGLQFGLRHPTFAATGETVEHLSAADQMVSDSPCPT